MLFAFRFFYDNVIAIRCKYKHYTNLMLQFLLISTYIITQVILLIWLVLVYDLLEDRCTTDVTITKFFIFYYIKQIDSMFLCVCSKIDHRGRKTVVRTSVTHLAITSGATFLFLPQYNIICDLLLNRRMATWNLFVK